MENERIEDFIELLNDAVFFADAETGLITNVNAQAQKLLGKPKDQIVGLHHSMPQPGEMVQSEAVKINTSRYAREGKEFIIGVFRDLRENANAQQKRAEERISQDKQRFEFLSRSAVDLLSLHDENEIIDTFAKSLKRMLPKTEVSIQQADTQKNGPFPTGTVRAVPSESGEAAAAYALDLEPMGDTQIRIMFYTEDPAFPENIEFIETFGRQASIAFQRTRLEKQYENVNKAKSAFLANFSHEIRTPMNAILGYTAELQAVLKGRPEYRYIQNILTSGNTLLNLINDVLDISKIEADRLTLAYEWFDLHSLVSEIESIFSIKVREKGLSFIVEYNGTRDCRVFFDKLRVRQIVLNLVSNAVKFTDKGEVILRVSLCKTGEARGDLVLDVSDTGTGIPVDHQKMIFEPFRQQNEDVTRGSEGTGLGLAITKRLVEMMNGEITLSSEPGKGSVFHVILRPAADGSESIPAAGGFREEELSEAPLQEVGPRLPETANILSAVVREAEDMAPERLSYVLDQLETDCRRRWEEARATHSFVKIDRFGEELDSLGAESGMQGLSIFGRVLREGAGQFDLPRITALLPLFEEMIHNLREIVHEQ